MPVDNDLYDRLSHTWWDEDGFLNLLKSGFNPARFGYMKRVLTDQLYLEPRGLSVLDVGSGGGLLAEEFAALGCEVTGVDPSGESVSVARVHADEQGLQIEYRQASGEALPFEEGRFRVVYCCDVLEHVDDVGQTIAEIARVLEPEGVFLYDTINRTRRSKLIMIKLAQDWSATAWADPGLHGFEMFIRPEEVESQMRTAGLEVRERVGFAPANPATALKAMWDRAHGKITYADMGERLRIQESPDTSTAYGGYASKPVT